MDTLFTVFTPTYNRKHTIGRTFESLQRQTCRDFEWLIIDDGSEDGTRDFVHQLEKQSDFPIRYFWQQNGGKHRAFNRGVREAGGKLFLNLDSDDVCLPDALECLKQHWEQIGDDRNNYVGVTGLCVDSKGQIVGDMFPGDIFDSNSIEMRTKYNVKGEKWGFQRTDVLKKFPFPELGNEKFITENIIWNRIATKYKTRFINSILRQYEPLDNGLSKNYLNIRIYNPKGTSLYYLEEMNLYPNWFSNMRSSINYLRFSLHASIPLKKLISDNNIKKFKMTALIGGILMYQRDKITLKH